MKILAADIGGTKTELLVAEVLPGHGVAVELHRARYPSRDFSEFAALLAAFLAAAGGAGSGSLAAAAFGVAGPVIGERCETTNLPWVLERGSLAEALGLPPARVALLNDFHALALALDTLGPGELEPLQAGVGVDPAGPRALIGAGTGLGQAIVLPDPRGCRVLATEGGHADFAPRDDLERRLHARLHARHGHVSYERLVSGPGIATLYQLLCDEREIDPQPATHTRIAAAADPTAVIGELALSGEDPACEVTIDRFLAIYGAEAGNLALKTLPTGGLYLAGGVTLRLLPRLRRGHLLAALLDKGRMRPLLERLPIFVIAEPHAGLLGARNAALGLLSR